MKKFRIYILMAFITAILLPSCSENATLENLTSQQNQNTEYLQMDIAEAQQLFARTLSKAISESYELRSFMQKEAMRRFDNDFNVFYHLVKNKVVYNDKTFRDILIDHCEDVSTLVGVEESLPLLNIYVPDLKFFWEFDAYLWDLSDSEVGIVCREDSTSTVFFAGEAVGMLDPMEIPGFPCLVVGNSDRVRVSNMATRSSEATYEFVLDAFNPLKTLPRTRHDRYDIHVAVDSPIPYAKPDELDPIVIAAYNEFKTPDDRHHQRENVYYGITKTNDQGTFRTNFAETLFRFRISSSLYGHISDHADDAKLLCSNTPGAGKGEWSVENILKNMWNGKTYMLEFYVANPVEGQQTVTPRPLVISIYGYELFTLSKIGVVYKNKTWFRKAQNTYYADPTDLKPRWVDPTKLVGYDGKASPIFLSQLNWNPYNTSLKGEIYVYEYDPSETIKETKTFATEFAAKFDASLDIGTKPSQKIGIGFNYTEKNSTTVEITRTTGSDYIGLIEHDFRYPIIKNDAKKNTEGYELQAINGGSIEVVLVPQRR